jgi:hypothetical protein
MNYKMDYLFNEIKQVAYSAATYLNDKDEFPLQITIICKGEVKYKFRRSSDKSIKFYNGEDFVQGFASNAVVLDFVDNFLLFDRSFSITWHREGEKGMSTPYKKETLERLLKLLVSDEVL